MCNFVQAEGFELQSIEIDSEISKDQFATTCELLSRFALDKGYKKVFLGCSGSHVAVDAIKHLADGDPVSAINSVKPEFMFNGVIFTKPLINMTPKEIGLYFHHQNLKSFNYDTQSIKRVKTIDRVIKDFMFASQINSDLTIHGVNKST
ncbi:hypothetical protein RF11_03177 [Thelohanellus kitauei]|uniref:Uncharacterized protein n=1 Tax=Thelohanellus kitauei TaxID=669202 RepID=A0A0C2MIZ0_THEKT|nr:hypothetical protein RF11_03177 [Thelohanellus kitauei]